MNTQDIISFKRVKQLAIHHLVLNRRSSLLRISGFCISIVLLLFISQVISFNYLTWNNTKYLGIFTFFYFIGGIVYSASAFAWLRTKEARYTYFMIPATAFEKFIFEFILRIVAYVLLVPVIYWFLANLEGSVFHLINPAFKNFQFSFGLVVNNFTKNYDNIWLVLVNVNSLLIFFILPFTGATFFRKNPFPKLLLFVVIVAVVFFLFGWLLYYLLDLQHTHSVKFFFISKSGKAQMLGAIILTISNVTALVAAYFNVKEKEV